MVYAFKSSRVAPRANGRFVGIWTAECRFERRRRPKGPGGSKCSRGRASSAPGHGPFRALDVGDRSVITLLFQPSNEPV
jgi:hypothetical protein